MNAIQLLIENINTVIKTSFDLCSDEMAEIQTTLHVDKAAHFGDLSCNAAMVLAHKKQQQSHKLAAKIKEIIEHEAATNKCQILATGIVRIEIAGPGFLNFFLHPNLWHTVARELHHQKNQFFQTKSDEEKKRYLLEFVSANPTGPLHFGHGRGAIIGDTLANVLAFLGHDVVREFYINDAGLQIAQLGISLKIRCQQEYQSTLPFPQDGYHGAYLIELAKQCLQEFGPDVIKKEHAFFCEYAHTHLLEIIKKTIAAYGVNFDTWFSEKRLHTDGSLEKALDKLRDKNLLYSQENATWFRSASFGDDKDRVIQKENGTYTYIAADIAYHKNKFDRKFDYLIDILGQDHHGYVQRLKATMKALDYPAENLHVILYQLVSLKHGNQAQKMSKRAGTLATLQDIIDTVGRDVARFFYLNRKAEAHLEFDLAVALKKTEENPVYYIHYAYVRAQSVINKARQSVQLNDFLHDMVTNNNQTLTNACQKLQAQDSTLLKKIVSLNSVLASIERTYATHQLAYYAIELAHSFHHYYAHNKILDSTDSKTSKTRLFITDILKNTLHLCLDLMGLSKPEQM